MRRGDVYWLRLPRQKPRPAIILSPDFLNDVRDRVLIVPCTSQRTDSATHTEFLLDGAALPKPTKAQCQDIATFRKIHLSGKIRALTPREIDAMNRAVEIATGMGI